MARKTQHFKKIFSELEEISAWFQRDDIDLDEALKKFARGQELIKAAKSELKQTENVFRAIAKPKEE